MIAIAASTAEPPALQDVDPRLRRERMRGAGRAVQAVDRGARGEARADRAVAGVDVGTDEAVLARRPALGERRGGRLRRAALPRRGRALLPDLAGGLCTLGERGRGDRGGGDGGDEVTTAHGHVPDKRSGAHLR